MRFEFQSSGCGSLGDLCAKALVLGWQMSPILAQPHNLLYLWRRWKGSALLNSVCQNLMVILYRPSMICLYVYNDCQRLGRENLVK